MAEYSDSVRSLESIHISVARARKLKGIKGDVLTSYVKLEFDGKNLGDSTKVDSSSESDAEYNFSSSFDCSLSEGSTTLEDVASKPVLVTIIEVLPKEKKQKEEKSSVLGQCTIDLLPLLVSSELEFKTSLEIHPISGSPLENADAKAEIDICISVNESLLDSDQILKSNLLTVRIGSAYSLPDVWSSTGSQYNYTVALPIPVNTEKDISLIFSNGSFKPYTEKEHSKQPIKWYKVPNANLSLPVGCFERIPMEEEKGDYRAHEFTDFRSETENDKNRVTWDIERRCHLEPEAKTEFQNKIAQTRYWPVEILRTVPSQPKGAVAGGGKKEKSVSIEEEGNVSYHGVCYVDLAPLLYPGVTSVAGAFCIHPFLEQELSEKTKRKNPIALEVARTQSSTSRVTGNSPVLKSKGGKDQGSTTVSKKGSAVKQSDTAAESLESQQNLEACAYTDSRTYLYMEFTLARPLVPRREPEQLASQVREYIPPRPLFKRTVGGAEKAVDDFHSQLSSVATMVLDEYREVFGADSSESFPEKQKERKNELIYMLNSSGKYFAFKEQLKHAVVKIVREKYMKTASFTNKDELQTFLTELYVYLVDEMHSALQKVLPVEENMTDQMDDIIDSEQLKRFAQEAEVNEEYDMASQYYQDRLSKNEKDPEHWLDYGTFNLLIGNHGKAKECFKETVALKDDYVEGLLMYGILCAGDEIAEAETVFERATSIAGKSSLPPSLPWTILALFYDSQGNDILAEYSFSEANRLNVLPVAPEVVDDGNQSDQEEVKDHSEKQADLDSSNPTVAETSSTLAPPSGTRSQHPGSAKSASTKGSKTATSTTKREGGAVRGGSAANSATSRDPDTKGKEPKDPEIAEHRSPPFTIFLQAAQWLLDRKALKFAEIALSKELLAPSGGPSAEYYIALTRLQMIKKEYRSGRESLKLATSMDNEHPDAWAMMGHLNYVSGDYETARDCYERTVAFVTDAAEMHSIYLRLASIYLQEEQFSKAKRTFLLGCKHSPTCISWLGVGIACYRLGEISESEDALAEANILNNSNADVWAYLSLVCLKTERKLEAEQSYKFAVKLGFKDEALLQEINSLQKEYGFGNPSF